MLLCGIMPRTGDADAATLDERVELPSSCCKIEDDDEALSPAVLPAPPGVTVSDVERRDDGCDVLSAAGMADGGGGGDAPPEL